MGSPFGKLIGMARAPIAAAMVGKTIGRAIEEGQIPVYVERVENSRNEILGTSSQSAPVGLLVRLFLFNGRCCQSSS
jgi:hypothetical protein